MTEQHTEQQQQQQQQQPPPPPEEHERNEIFKCVSESMLGDPSVSRGDTTISARMLENPSTHFVGGGTRRRTQGRRLLFVGEARSEEDVTGQMMGTRNFF